MYYSELQHASHRPLHRLLHGALLLVLHRELVCELHPVVQHENDIKQQPASDYEMHYAMHSVLYILN